MRNELRHALRSLRRAPGFAVSAILALALGIGANAAVFSVVYAVLLRPLPYPEPGRLVKLSEFNAAEQRDNGRVSRGTFVDWVARARTVEAIAAHTSIGETLWGSGDRYAVVKSAAVSAELFGVLRAAPILGRAFRPDDERKMIIGYDLWQRSFGGAPDVIGRVVTIEGRFAGEVIGVMPRGFSFPHGADAWANLRFGGTVPPAGRRTLAYHTVARLASGRTLEDARIEFDQLSLQLAAEHPESNAGWTARVIPLAGSDTAQARAGLLALLAAVAGVLLIGCANVANLLLARAASRQRETAVRLALGASLRHLLRQCLAEAVVLSGCAAVAGVAMAWWIANALVSVAPADIPRLGESAAAPALTWFAAAAGLLTTALLVAIPALHASAAAGRETLRPDTRAATPRAALMRRLLIGGEVAVVVLLLTGALLFLRTFVSLRGVDLGFEADRVWNVSTRWPVGRFATTPGVRMWPAIQRSLDGLIDEVASLPGVEAVGVMSDVPLTGAQYSGTMWRDDAPGASGLTPPTDPRDRWKADLSVASSGYFRALGIPFLRGRNFSETDRWTDEQLNAKTAPDGGAMIVNQAFASRYFGGQDPVGRAMVISDDQTFGWHRTIVGVVADVRSHAVGEEAVPTVFIPHAQHPDMFLPSVLVRTSLPAASVAPALRARIERFDPQLLVQRIRPMDDVIAGALTRPRFNLLLVGSFALLGLLLAAVGIYGVVSFLVTQRTREIGVRMALGARAQDVRRLVVRDGMTPVMAGAVCGLAAAIPASRAIRSLLFGVAPFDALSFAVAPLLLVLVALAACLLPARRASRVDPLVALRDQ
jgi:predicted permease